MRWLSSTIFLAVVLPSKALLFQLFLRQWISAALLQELQNLGDTNQWSTSLPFRSVGATEKGMTAPNGFALRTEKFPSAWAFSFFLQGTALALSLAMCASPYSIEMA